MTYKHYEFTAKQISNMIYGRTRKRVKPQSVNDHRNGKRNTPATLHLIAEAVAALEEKRNAKR